MKGVIYNEDCTEFFYINRPETMSGELVDTFVDSLADAGFAALFSNPNGMRINVPSKVREVMWHGYDPNGPDDQPFFNDYPKERLKNIRPMLNSMIRLAEQGIDFHARALARCRQRGMEGWISIRMNDVHDVDLPNSALLSTFWKEHHDYWRVPYRFSAWFDRQLDFARPEVRQHYWALIEETLSRYDLDGLELDFMRFPHYFRIGHELEGGEILTAWLRDVRGLAQAAAKRLGHPVKLAVRCPPHPDTARNMGLDGVRWAREGLVDLVIVTPFWETSDFNLPIVLWKRLLEGTTVELAAGAEILVRPYLKSAMAYQTPQTTCGVAAAALRDGADCVYLFNHFYDMPGQRTGQWAEQAEAIPLIHAMSSLATLDALPRRHIVTYADTHAPGEPGNTILPVEGKLAIFRLRTGPRPSGRTVQVTLGFELLQQPPALFAPPSVRVNSVPCSAHPQQQGGTTCTYDVPDEALTDESHTIEVDCVEDKPFKVVWVEMSIAGKRGGR